MKQPEMKGQKTKEQLRQYMEDAKIDIENISLEDFIKELYLPEIQRILSEETTGWVDEYLKTQNSEFESLTEEKKQKEREKLLEKFKDLKTREDLLQKLEEIGRKDKITNIFGMIYIPEDYEIIAVTDVHGDILVLDRAIEEFEDRKRNNKKVAFVCLGDFVDRGEYSFEVVKRLFELKRKYGDEVVILKADHEAEIGRIMPADFYDKVGRGGEEKAKALYNETFLKLPYGIIWSDFLFFHGGLPLFSKFEFKQKDPNQSDADFIKEKAKLGGLIGLIDETPEGIKETKDPSIQYPYDYMAIQGAYWDDIYEYLQEPKLLSFGRRINWHPNGVALALSEMGFKGLIRGHDIDPLLGSEIAYTIQGKKETHPIITFSTNQSNYAEKNRNYKSGCFLSLSRQEKEGKVYAVITAHPIVYGVQPEIVAEIPSPSASETSPEPTSRAEVEKVEATPPPSSSKGEGPPPPQSPEVPSGVEGEEPEKKPEKPEEITFDKLYEKKIQELMGKYGHLIKLLPGGESILQEFFIEDVPEMIKAKILREFERVFMEALIRLKPGKHELEEALRELVFKQNEDIIESLFKIKLANFLLGTSETFEDESKKQRVIEFLEKELTIEELSYVARMIENKAITYIGKTKVGEKEDEIKVKIDVVEIYEQWGIQLLLILARRVQDVEKLKKYIETVIDNYKEKLDELRDNLIKIGMPKNKVDEIINALKGLTKASIGEALMKAKPDQIQKWLESFQQLAQAIEKVSKAEGKEEKEKAANEMMGKLKETLEILTKMLGTGVLLWFALIGFFFPLWLIAKMDETVGKYVSQFKLV